MRNVAALLRSRMEVKPGVKIYEYFSDLVPPDWFKGEVVQPRRQGLITVRYQDGSKIDQEEREVRQWLDVRELPEWKKMVAAVVTSLASPTSATGCMETCPRHRNTMIALTCMLSSKL